MIQWFARGGGIARVGPFKTQIEAVESIRQIAETDEQYHRATFYGEHRPQPRGGFPPDAFVWPEES